MSIHILAAHIGLRRSTRRILASALVAAAILTSIAPATRAASLIFTTPSSVIDAIAFDPTGNLYYLDRSSSTTQLISRTLSSGYTDSTVLFDYADADAIFGSFVTVNNGRVYFGESTDGTIRSLPLGGGTPTTNATVAFNYDLEFSPVSGKAFVSANPLGGANNQIFEVNLSSGATTLVVTNTNDFSGPIAFDTAGALYYGSSGFNIPTDIFMFTDSAIMNAIDNTNPIDFSLESSFLATAGNSAFDFVAGEGLYRNFSGSDLSLVDLTIPSETAVPDPPPGFIGPIAHNGSALYAVTTNFTLGSSSFFIVPEPSSALLIYGAVFAVFARRRRIP
ncbi:MAG: hypothetical protein AAGD22_05415 [Verrucomicrobiota bacterium]